MGKLHELLAVEGELRSGAKNALASVVDFFKSGAGMSGHVTTFSKLDESLEDQPSEIQVLSSSVDEQLAALKLDFSKFVDATVEKEISNTKTMATVELKGIDFLGDLPATALLNLEGRLEELDRAYRAIPTLDPSEQWEFDTDKGHFVSGTRTLFRTKKVPKAFVAYKATTEHPAQVTVFNEDINQYRVEKTLHSGMLTPSQKKERLDRLAELQRAVKKARIRANDVESIPVSIGEKIFDFINKGEL